jgi:cytochrome c oxidase subunit II
VRLAGGATVSADAAYLRRSILTPAESVVFGYNPLMPAYDGYLAPRDVDDLVAYLESLPPAAGSEGPEASRSPVRRATR